MRIQQAAFAAEKPFLKGALHVHTTRSDGKDAPQDVIRAYHQKGYRFVALTDHNILNHLNLCPDVPMTILSGVERDMGMPGRAQDKPLCVHVVGLGVPGDERIPPQDARPEWAGRGQCCADAQPMIDQMHAWGMKTFYAHPEWSGTPWRDFSVLQGNFAMEIWNSGCALENALDNHAAYWDEALDEGRRLWGVAVDDGHCMAHHGHGWVMVAAQDDPASILSALEAGAFYASCGPQIHDFYVEDGVAHVLCSEAASVQFVTLRHPLPCRRSAEGTLTAAQCSLPEGLRYIRAVVKDAQGRQAWTNPIFLR